MTTRSSLTRFNFRLRNISELDGDFSSDPRNLHGLKITNIFRHYIASWLLFVVLARTIY